MLASGASLRLLLAAVVAATWVHAQQTFQQVTFANKHRYYFDNDGNAIDSVNGHISFINGVYFWIASPTACGQATCSPSSYTSPDLVHWQFNGALFDINDPVNAAACSGIFGGCGRPKVIFNELTQKYVFYGFGSKGFNMPGIPVFTSDSLTSGYTFVGNMIQGRFEFGDGAEDLGLAVIDGKGYVIWTTFNMTSTIIDGTLGDIWPPFLQTVLIQELTPDFLNGTGDAFPVIQPGNTFPVLENTTQIIDGQVESPDLIKRGDLFYMIGSSTCAFCNGTNTLAYRSTSIQGPWTLQVVDSGDTCGGQAMGVATIPAPPGVNFSSYLYHADAFSTSPPAADFVSGAGHSIWSLNFADDGSILPIDCGPDATFTIEAPLGNTSLVPIDGLATLATDGSGNFASYRSESGWPAASFYQTWTSSKTGTLTTLGINLAANNPNANLTVVTFRYPDEAALLSPFFFWEELGRFDVNFATDVTPRHKVVQVPVNAAVAEGDRLGFALIVGSPLAGTNITPWSYLITDLDGRVTDHVLYALVRGRVSVRYSPTTGFTSPLVRQESRELKWWANVV